MSTFSSRNDDQYGGPLRRPAVLAALLLIAVGLPWLVPAVPHLLGSVLPEHATSSRVPVVQDPPVPPPSVTPGPDLPGVRSTTPRDLTGVRLPQAGRPLHLDVDRLSVTSGVVPISGNSGTLLPPSDPQVLGWWEEGAVPGAASGTAVLTGHTVHTGGGAFDHLRLLVPGDRLRVRTPAGQIHYRVGSVRIYTTAALARHSREIFRLGGPGRLVLITCSDFDGTVYLTNTVVVAHPVARSGS